MIDTRNEIFKRLGIENADQIRGNKMIEFASLLNEVEPAVAREIITQIPEFTHSALEVFTDLVRTQNASNDASCIACHDAYRKIIDTLSRQVDDPDIPFEQKKVYLEMMMDAADRMSRKDAENKDFQWKVFGVCAAALAGCVTGVLTVLGIRQAEVRS